MACLMRSKHFCFCELLDNKDLAEAGCRLQDPIRNGLTACLVFDQRYYFFAMPSIATISAAIITM